MFYDEKTIMTARDAADQWQRNALASPSIGSIIFNICERHGLSNDQCRAVSAICGYVFLQLTPVGLISKEIQENCKVPAKVADKIQHHLIRGVFQRYLHRL